MEDQVKWESFLLEMFKQLSFGDYQVIVKCAGDKEFPAKIIGFDKNYMTVRVRFDSDTLTQEENVRVESTGFGGTSYDEDNYHYEVKNVPVKEITVFAPWNNIKLK